MEKKKENVLHKRVLVKFNRCYSYKWYLSLWCKLITILIAILNIFVSKIFKLLRTDHVDVQPMGNPSFGWHPLQLFQEKVCKYLSKLSNTFLINVNRLSTYEYLIPIVFLYIYLSVCWYLFFFIYFFTYLLAHLVSIHL